MLISTIIWSVVLAISFELARKAKTYDYRSFIRTLLGKAWPTYELVYGIGLILVVSVLGSAAGELATSMTGVPSIFGIIVMMVVVGLMAFYGTNIIETALSLWSFALYGAFVILIVMSMSYFGEDIAENVFMRQEDSQWFKAGVTYAAYNIGIMPAMIFVVRHIQTKKEAITSGLLGGVIAMIPGFLIYMALLASWPNIIQQSVPVDFLLIQLDMSWFTVIFRIILFGTFIETGVGLIHGFNERIASTFKESGNVMPRWMRAAIATSILLISVFVADAIGIIDLIAKGYGALTWGYIIVFVIPVLSIGIFKIAWNNRKQPS